MSITIKLPPWEVARAALVVIGVAFICYLVWQVQEVLFLVMSAILLATAIEPLVKLLRRGPFTRGTGVLLVYTLIVLAIGLPAYAAIPSVIDQAATFTAGLPDRLQQVRGNVETLRPAAAAALMTGTLDNLIRTLQAPQGPAQDQIVQAGTTAAHTLFSFVTVFVLAF